MERQHQLMEEIERCLPDGGEWCSLTKAQTLAKLIVDMQAATVVEIGVWLGGSLIPMLLALKYVNEEMVRGPVRAIAIDPWSSEASIAGENPENAQWWGAVDHEDAFRHFVERLGKHEVSHLCEIWRKRSDDCTPPDSIDLLHVDGNHTDQAVRDIKRFCPHVRVNGIAVLDDVSWVGGNVTRGVEIARAMGFVELYPLGTGIVMKKAP